jgi:hypothetical protein
MKPASIALGMLCLTILSAPAPAAEQAAACDRACLKGLMDGYVAALLAHDPARLPVSPDVKFTENLVAMPLGKAGLWRTVTGRRDFDIYVSEPDRGNVAWFGIVKENDLPVFLAVRLKVEARAITEIETMVGRSRLTAAATVGAPRTAFAEIVPPDQRSSRQELIRIANTKWDAFEDTSKGKLIPYADDCERHDNGFLTAGNKPRTGDNTSAIAGNEGGLTTCRQQMTSGRFNNGNTVDPRRIWAVDRERGLVVGLFTPNVPGDRFEIALNNGEKMKAGPDELIPFTIQQVEMFKIVGGKIHMVEVVYGPRVPYGMRSPFDMETLWTRK